MISCDSILLGQTCNTTRFIYFSEHLENIKVSNITCSHALKTHIESPTEEVIKLRQSNKKQHRTLNRVDNFLEQLCSGYGQQKSYTASTNTYKRKKIDVDITGEDNDTDYVYVKTSVSKSKPYESSLKSKSARQIFSKPNNRTLPIGDVFEAQYTGERVKICRKLVL